LLSALSAESKNKKLSALSVSAVNIIFTKIVTDAAKSVKSGVGMGVGN